MAEVTCPINPRWVIKVMAFLPRQLWGKLEPYAECSDVKDALIKAGIIEKTAKE